jgi:ubiquinone/menaquinone biosynthesis C-methylase UbiE
MLTSEQILQLPIRERQHYQAEVIRGSGLFDDAYYAVQNPDVVASGMDLLQHYIQFGAKEGRNPSATFITKYYVGITHEIHEKDINPLYHFLQRPDRRTARTRPTEKEILTQGRLDKVSPGWTKDKFWGWYHHCRRDDGIHHLTETSRFLHDEDWYADNFKSDTAMGHGAVCLLRHLGGDDTRPALEIGCGAGALSFGLAKHSMYPKLIVTDPSVRFLKITSAQIERMRIGQVPDYAIMSGEDIFLFPDGSLSLIVMRYTLHHIWNLNAFFAECNRVLIPGGLLLFEEPHVSFFTHACAMMPFMLDVAKAKGINLPVEIENQVSTYLSAIETFVRGDIDKSSHEDKHLFSTERILELSEKNGFSFKYILNRNLASFVHTAPETDDKYLMHGEYDYYEALLYYLVTIMRFGEQFGESLEKTMRSYCEKFSKMFKGTILPPNIIIGACIKR